MTCGQCVRVPCEGITQGTHTRNGVKEEVTAAESPHSCSASPSSSSFPPLPKCFLDGPGFSRSSSVPLQVRMGLSLLDRGGAGQGSSRQSDLALEELYIPPPAGLSISRQTVCVETFALKGDCSVGPGTECSRLACCSDIALPPDKAEPVPVDLIPFSGRRPS